MKGISHYIDLEINESVMKELKQSDVINLLTKLEYKKGKDYDVKGKDVILKSENIANDLMDDLTDYDEYESTYDDVTYKLIIFGK